jgi:hypothetical protein
VKTKANKTPNPIVVIYRAMMSPVLRLMDKISGRDVVFERKSKKAA